MTYDDGNDMKIPEESKVTCLIYIRCKNAHPTCSMLLCCYAIFVQASLTLFGQVSRSLVRQGARQTSRPLLVTTLRRDEITITDHACDFFRRKAKLCGGHVAIVVVLRIGQEHDSDLGLVVAAEEEGLLVEVARDDHVRLGDGRHLR